MFQKIFRYALLSVCTLASALRGQNAEMLHGKVLDASTGAPLNSAIVLFSPLGKGTITNSAGEFRVATKGPVDSLIIRFMGYHPRHLAITELRPDQAIALTPSTMLFREVTVTAKRYAATAAEIPAAGEVIASQTPRLATTQNVGEAIAQMQSLFIKEYGGLSGLKTVTMRGASEGQVLVLEDGFRLNNPQGGWVDFNLLPSFSVEKIEVVRGGASAQYGSEAVGGIIHIRTLPPPQRFTPKVEYTLGSYGTNAARFSLGQRFGKFAALAGYGKLQTEGDYPLGIRTVFGLSNNAFAREDIYLRGDYVFSSQARLSAFHKDIHSDREVAGSLSFPSPEATQVDDNRITGASFSKQSGAWLDLNMQASVQRLVQAYVNPDPFFPTASRHQVDARELIVHNRSRVEPLELLYGFEWARNEINSTDIQNPVRDQRSAFVQAEWRFVRVQHDNLYSLSLLPALRIDDYSDAGTHTSPKLGLVWKWERLASLSIHASAAKSFRVPAMNDLFWPSGPYVAGNPNLKSETGQQYDGGVLLQWPGAFGSWRLSFDTFYYRLTNLITWIPDENFRFSPRNIARAKTSGFEPALAWHAPQERFTLRLSYTKLSAKDDGEEQTTHGKKLLYRPEHKLDANVSAQLFGATVGASYQLISARFVQQDNAVSLPGYRLTSAFGNYDFALAGGYRVRLATAVNNLFDKRIQIIAGYPTPGREYRLTLGVGR